MNRRQKIELVKQVAAGRMTADQVKLFGWTQLPTWVLSGYDREQIVEQYGEIKEVNGKVYARIEAGEVPRWFNY